MTDQVPTPLRIWKLMQSRVPEHIWDVRRIALACSDFDDKIDTEEVAARCADWMMSGRARRVSDPEGTLRGFFERAAEKKRQEKPASMPELQRYDRPENRSA